MSTAASGRRFHPAELCFESLHCSDSEQAERDWIAMRNPWLWRSSCGRRQTYTEFILQQCAGLTYILFTFERQEEQLHEECLPERAGVP